MRFDQGEKILLEMAVVGMLAAIGKMLIGGQEVTLRLALGRVMIGAGLSMAAGAVLIEFPQLPPEGLVGLGSAFGILGLEFLERLVQRWLVKRDRADDKTNSGEKA